MPEHSLIALFAILGAFCVIYGVYLGINKAIDWMIAKIFDA